jgi:hypothetical protein
MVVVEMKRIKEIMSAYSWSSGKPAFNSAASPVQWTSSASPGLGTALALWHSAASSTMKPLSMLSF